MKKFAVFCLRFTCWQVQILPTCFSIVRRFKLSKICWEYLILINCYWVYRQASQTQVKWPTSFYMLYIIDNWKKKALDAGEWHYNMLMKKKKQIKSRKKNYNTSMELSPDQKLLKMKILRASFVAHSMSHCLNPNYAPFRGGN